VIFKAVPSRVKLALSVSPSPLTKLKVCMSPSSRSVALRVPTVALAALFSARLAGFREMSVGEAL